MDMAQIGEVLGLASNAVGVTVQATTTLKAIKGLFESGKPPDNKETIELLNTLAAQLTAANMSNVQSSEMLRALGSELQRQDEFEREKARYELVETTQHDMVFRLRKDAANGQPIHYVCPVG